VPLTATTLDVVDATIARRIGAHHRSLRAPVCSVGKSALLLSPHAFGSPPHSPSTRGRRILGFSSMTTAWHASWVVRLMTRSSFATFPCILQTLHALGLNIFRPTRSTTGLI